MKKLIIFTLANLFIITSTIAQNNVWSLPPNYYNPTNFPPVQPLPAPGVTTPTSGPYNVPNYAKQSSEFMHNAIQDANGELLFFVVDGMVYDSEGYGINVITDISTLKGYADIAIIPVPGNCQQYYIVTTANSSTGHLPASVRYAILDLSVQSLSSGRKGVLIDPTPNNGLPGNQSLYVPSPQSNTFPLSDLAFGFSSNTDPEACVSMAVTKLKPDNTRFLFIMGEQSLFRFEVTSFGISYLSYKFNLSSPFTPTISETVIRSEMEIIETANGYRIAFAYTNFSCNSCNPTIPGGYTLFVGELNSLGEIVSHTTKTLANLPIGSALHPAIKGIEFSPNGNYLYLTHDVSTVNTTPFKIYDVVNQNFIPDNLINAQLITDIPNFKNSYIELGSDGLLYLANANNLATIGNSDNPTSSGLTWNNSVFSFSMPYHLSQWGLTSTSYLSQKIYPLPDQIDGMDYTAYLVDTAIAGVECCKKNSVYDISSTDNNNEFTGTHTWDATGNNPWSWTSASTNNITVKDQMIIKSGANITINNMVFEFAPEAQLIIENGATLTINGTTLTVDTRCDRYAMWHGVEVWGTGTGSFQTNTSGKFIAQESTISRSTIEHALEATANYQHNLSSGTPVVNVAITNSEGGIINLSNTDLRNNQYDVYMIDYQSMLGFSSISDQSQFVSCNFFTDDVLNNPAIMPLEHVHLSNVNGIRFSGCDFQNTATAGTFSYLQRGEGIYSEESKFSVNARCLSLSNPCNNLYKSHFNNLTRGITAISVNPLKTTQITHSEFNNIWRGIYLRGLKLANVSDNIFDIGMNSGYTVSFGLAMQYCDGYKVENNDFHTSYNGYLGCYVDNSLSGANEIYRNTFTDLVVGSQAANQNGDGSSAGTGLVFRCNDYHNTNSYDILVSSGLIKAFHGNCVNQLSPSNNRFSYTAQIGDFWMTNNTTPIGFNVSYQMSLDPNGLQTVPRDYPISATHYNIVNTNPTFCTNSIFNPTTSCPKRIKKTKGQHKQAILQEKQIITSLKAQLDNNNTANLLAMIKQQPAIPAGQLKGILEDAEPLSSQVLLALINSNFPEGKLKDVLEENAPLSTDILLALINKTPAIAPGILKDILEESTPLSTYLILALLNKTTPVPYGTLKDILEESAPLSPIVISKLESMNIPNGIMEDILENQDEAPDNEADNLSEGQLIEQEITYHESLITRANNNIMRELLFNDSIPTKRNYKDVANYLKNEVSNKTNNQNQLLVNALMANQDFVVAQQKINTLDTCVCVDNINFCKLNNTLIQCQQYPQKEKIIVSNTSLQQTVNEVATATTNRQEVTSAKVLREVVGLSPRYYVQIEMLPPPSGNARIASTSNNNGVVVEEKPRLSIFPNPVNEEFTLLHNLNLANGTILMIVYDVMGKEMLSKTINQPKQIVNISRLKSGMYFYTISQNGNTIKTDKLMVK